MSFGRVLQPRHIGLALGAGSLAATGAFAASLYQDDGLKRSMTFWVRAMPIYAHYRATEFWIKHQPGHVQDAAFEKLHDRYSSKVEDLILTLRGFYLKIAQVGSTRDELLPPQYLSWAKKMQGLVPSDISFGTIKDIIEDDLGAKLEDIFSEFQVEPIGAASIGQVHKARLRNGQLVAVKVMYPDIEQKFRADIKTAKTFCSLAQPAHLPFMNEVEKQFLTEFDYRLEAENLNQIRANVLPVFGRKVYIPKPFTEYCSKRVLVMEYLDGVKLDDGITAQYSRIAERLGTTLEALQAEQKKKLELGLVKPRSLFHEMLITSFTNGFLHVADYVKNSWRFLLNMTIAKIGVIQPVPYTRSEYMINLGSILQLLLDVHAHQIFVDGSFNADCHPGNILLLNDGKLGLIDYGQVKHIKPDTQIKYSRLIKALAKDDKDEVIERIKECGLKTARMDPDVLYRLACFFNDRDTDDITHGKNIQLFLEEMDRLDPVIEQDDEFIMLSRVNILLRGMGLAFNIRLRIAQYWSRYADQCLRHNKNTL